MQRSKRELWASIIAILFITSIYLFVYFRLGNVPPASDLFGHMIGVLGFILMLMTEILYSIRKRSRRASWGRMSSWLSFHIFTGIVGPYMVLLHTSWKFNGLAGLTLILTVIIVISGFIGRYIYTAIPRSADGVALQSDQIESQMAIIQNELTIQLQNQQDLGRRISKRVKSSQSPPAGARVILLRTFYFWLEKLKWWWLKLSFDSYTRRSVQELENLITHQLILQSQLASLAMTRKFMALWHTIHIPIGLVLFTAAFIHIGASIYYATLLR
jgi:hypothetical protein